MSLKAKDIKVDYTSAFDFLSNWVPKLNNTFEPEKYGFTESQKSPYVSSNPILLDMVRDIGTFWKTNKELIWLPNIKQGFFGITQPTEAEMARYR